MKYSFVIPVHSHDIEHFYQLSERNDTEIIIVNTSGKNLNIKGNIREIHRKNAGYAEAVNAGIREACGAIIIVCNDDIFLDKDFLMNIDEDIDIQLPLVFAENNSIESMGAYIDFMGYARHNKAEAAEHIMLTGSVFIIKKCIAEQMVLDEDYFLYYEDTDLSMHYSFNGNIQVNVKLKAIHSHSFSTSDIKRYFLQRNRILFITKHWRYFGLFRLLIIYAFEYPIMLFQTVYLHSLSPINARIDALKLLRKFYGKSKNSIH